MSIQFTKLSDTRTFKIKSFEGLQYKAWDKENSKWITSDTPQKGLSAKFKFIAFVNDTQDAYLELSNDQLGQILVGAFKLKKQYDMIEWEVKTNGKTGMEIRYWINPLRLPNSQPYTGMGDVGYPAEKKVPEVVDESAIPF